MVATQFNTCILILTQCKVQILFFYLVLESLLYALVKEIISLVLTVCFVVINLDNADGLLMSADHQQTISIIHQQ